MSPNPLNVGDLAPDFELTTDSGATVKLSDFRGRRVVLYFYPKDDTSGCTTQACGFRDAYPVIEEQNAVVLGVSPDSVADLAKWRAAENLPYNLLSDPDNEVSQLYNAYGEKSMYGNTYMGVIRSHFVIDAEGKFEDVQIKVSPKDSINRALKQLG